MTPPFGAVHVRLREHPPACLQQPALRGFECREGVTLGCILAEIGARDLDRIDLSAQDSIQPLAIVIDGLDVLIVSIQAIERLLVAREPLLAPVVEDAEDPRSHGLVHHERSPR